MSPPARGRGLKHRDGTAAARLAVVAPRAGAWIETCSCTAETLVNQLSPPARGRGLKQGSASEEPIDTCVAPRAGAWIETAYHRQLSSGAHGRPPRGGVD